MNIPLMLANLEVSLINVREKYLATLRDLERDYRRAFACKHEFEIAKGLQSPTHLYLKCSCCGVLIVSDREIKDMDSEFVNGRIYDVFMGEIRSLMI